MSTRGAHAHFTMSERPVGPAADHATLPGMELPGSDTSRTLRHAFVRPLLGWIVPLLACGAARAQESPPSRLEALGLDWLPAQVSALAERLETSPSDTVHLETEPTTLFAWLEEPDLVIALDENGNGRVDEIEDCFVVDLDHRTDPGLDRVVDWQDLESDGKADRQCLFSVHQGSPGGPEFIIEARDDGRSHRGFWSLARWQYSQHENQWDSDFSGDQRFTSIRFDEKLGAYEAQGECPFVFYDPDDDGWTEEVIRFSGSAQFPKSIRWSFDTDNDGGWPSQEPELGRPDAGSDEADRSLPYDYDLSVTAEGDDAVPPDMMDTLQIRNGAGLALLSWDRAREFASKTDWQRALFVFDEVDANNDPTDEHRRERWEGVIAEGVQGFPKIGGPGCGRMGKRYELRRPRIGDPVDRTGPVSLYLSEVDGRIHLYGAKTGWIEIDHDEDLITDARLEMRDEDGDGFFDTWNWDGDADGNLDDTYQAFDPLATPLPMEWEAIHRAEEEIREASGGLDQYERFRADIERWIVAGKFVPLPRP